MALKPAMLIILSPAKNMNFDPAALSLAATIPAFLSEARSLAGAARALSPARLKKLMGISDKLAALNHERFAAFRGDGKSNVQKPAVLAFNGEVYLGLDAATMTPADFAFAQQHVRILSGLYGALRPLDLIEPYRLEMGSRLKNARGRTLYDFWRKDIAAELRRPLAGRPDPVIVNLASQEYFAAVDVAALRARVITPAFKDEKDGKLRTLQFFAKRARGAMTRWAIDRRIARPEALKDCNADGYRFSAALSGGNDWVFTRPQPPLKSATPD